MKALFKSISIIAISMMIFAYGCDKNPASPEEDTNDELTDTEKMVLVAAEVSTSSGGITSDLETAYSAAKGEVGGLKKAATFDTTISNDWLSYHLTLKYYSVTGQEQERFTPLVTARIDYKGSVSGSKKTTVPKQELNINRVTNLDITNVNTNIITINGTSTNNSGYKLNSSGVDFDISPNSELTATELKINLTSGTFIPISGKIDALIRGHLTKSGIGEDKDFDYSFNITIEFTGDAEAIVTLPSGEKFKLNLLTGEFEKV